MTSDLANHAGASSPSPLYEAKLALRRRVLAWRDALPREDRTAAGLVIAARVLALPSFHAARTVLLTMPFRSEWDPLPLVQAALAAGKTVTLPRIDNSARMIEACVIRDVAIDVAPGHQGIPEPRPHCAAMSPTGVDWVLVPGVAFDRDGRRLGYGGGYYDRLLPLLAAGTPRVAGAFDLQLVERVPSGPHDLAVDTIVTQSQVVDVGR